MMMLVQPMSIKTSFGAVGFRTIAAMVIQYICTGNKQIVNVYKVYLKRTKQNKHIILHEYITPSEANKLFDNFRPARDILLILCFRNFRPAFQELHNVLHSANNVAHITAHNNCTYLCVLFDVQVNAFVIDIYNCTRHTRKH